MGNLTWPDTLEYVKATDKGFKNVWYNVSY